MDDGLGVRWLCRTDGAGRAFSVGGGQHGGTGSSFGYSLSKRDRLCGVLSGWDVWCSYCEHGFRSRSAQLSCSSGGVLHAAPGSVREPALRGEIKTKK